MSEKVTAGVDLDALERRYVGLASVNTVVAAMPISHLIAELRALRAVVEAAIAYCDRIEAEAAAVEPWNAPEIDNGIQQAVAEYDRLTGERPPEPKIPLDPDYRGF